MLEACSLIDGLLGTGEGEFIVDAGARDSERSDATATASWGTGPPISKVKAVLQDGAWLQSCLWDVATDLLLSALVHCAES